MNFLARAGCVAAFYLILAVTCNAQAVTGLPPFGTFGGSQVDTIDLANLNSHISIPILTKPGRNVSVSYDVTYDSTIWTPVSSSGVETWEPTGAFGWTFQGLGGVQYEDERIISYCYTNLGPPWGNIETGVVAGYYVVYSDLRNTPHLLGPVTTSGGTCGSGYSGGGTATDGSGYAFTVDNSGDITVTARNGAIVYWTYSSGSLGTPFATDTNGNQVSISSSGVITDTLGQTALTVAGQAPNPTTFTYSVPSGSTVRYSMDYSPYTVETNFGCAGISDYAATSTNLVSQINLPDGTKYLFSYETTPGDSHTPHYVTGRLASITLPTGGVINYTYVGGNNGIECGDGSAAGLTRQTPDGAWSYSRVLGTSPASTTTITDPTGNQLVMNFQGLYVTEKSVYQGSASSGTLLQTINDCYNGTSPSGSPATCNSATITPPITRVTQLTQWPTVSGGLESKTDTFVNSYGLTTEVDLYAYGVGTPGALIRKSVTAYASLGSGIFDRASSFTVTNGAGSTVAQTEYTYDSAALTSVTGVAQHNDTQYGTGDTVRGNVTTVKQWVSGSTYLSATRSYDTTGQILKSTDFAGNITSFNYSDNLYTDNGASPPSSFTPSKPTNAFVRTVSVPILGTDATFGYYVATGDIAVSIDQNGADSYAHFDSFGRTESTVLPPSVGGSRGWTLIQYPGTTDTEIDTYLSIASSTPSASCSSCNHQQAMLDSTGRQVADILANDPDGATSVATTYDALGRVYSTTNPYRSTSDPTYGIQTTSYDSLDRVTSTTAPDGSATHSYYGSSVSSNGGNGTQLCSSSTYGLGYPSLKVDPSAKKRQRWTDAVGRIIEVDEPDSTGGLNIPTCMLYDALGNVTQIIQGTEARSFSYDGLSRLTSATSPETGTVANYYTTQSGGLCSGAAVLICRRVDARGTQTTNTYDALNRITSTSYSDGTPTVNYFYEQTSYDGLTIQNGKGRLTGMSDGAGESAYSYDLLGRVVQETHTVAGVTKSMSYAYNLDGSISSVVLPSGRQLNYSVGNAQRLQAIVDASSGVSYVSGAVYAPMGSVSSVTLGKTTSFAGVASSFSYNNRLELTNQQASSASGSVLNLSYGFASPPGNNGYSTSLGNNLDTGRSTTLSTDNLNRILTAQSQAASGPDCWGQSFGYDRWGNLLTVTVTRCTGTPLSLSETNNQIVSAGFSYNAAGDMTGDGINTYTYDAENRITSAAGVNYVYDGRDFRVEKSSGTLYWRGYLGDASSESNLAGSITNDYVFFAGQRVARIDSGGNVYYYFTDRVGSTRAITTSSGGVCYSADFTPFGSELAFVNTCPQNYKFATYERDSETGLDYGFYRYYSARLGRFAQPDPLAGKIISPQSLNRYSYSLNEPCDVNDPLGLAPCILNIVVKNNVGLSAKTLDSIKSQINALFGPSVSVSFGTSGSTTLNIDTPAAGNTNYGGAIANTNWANIWPSNIAKDFGNSPSAMGTIGAHELVHAVAGWGDVPVSKSNPNDIMNFDNNKNQASMLKSNSFQLTAAEKAALLKACQSLSSPTTSNDEANPALAGDLFGLDEFAEVPAEPTGTVTTSQNINLPAACTNGTIQGGCTVVGAPPVTNQGVDSGSGDPQTGDPGADDPGAGDPGGGDPTGGDPGIGDPGDPGGGDPCGDGCDPDPGDPGGDPDAILLNGNTRNELTAPDKLREADGMEARQTPCQLARARLASDSVPANGMRFQLAMVGMG
jgi:RHS repeat-associated protein